MENEFNASFGISWEQATDQLEAGNLAGASKSMPGTQMFYMIGSHQAVRKNNICPFEGWYYEDEESVLGYGNDEIIFMSSHLGKKFEDRKDSCEAIKIFGSSYAVHMDGGGSVQLVVDGKIRNMDDASDARHVVNAVALVEKKVVEKNPIVYSVTPRTAILDQLTTFTVIGRNLPSTLAFWLDDCSDVTPLGGSPFLRQFSCTPSFTSGLKSGAIKDDPGGTLRKDFNVNVVKVDSVSPTIATLNQLTTFTVTGQNLPSTLAFWVDDCLDVTPLGGSSTSKQFTCTPSFTSGLKSGVVKDMPDGITLETFSVDIQ